MSLLNLVIGLQLVPGVANRYMYVIRLHEKTRLLSHIQSIGIQATTKEMKTRQAAGVYDIFVINTISRTATDNA